MLDLQAKACRAVSIPGLLWLDAPKQGARRDEGAWRSGCGHGMS